MAAAVVGGSRGSKRIHYCPVARDLLSSALYLSKRRASRPRSQTLLKAHAISQIEAKSVTVQSQRPKATRM